MKKISSWILIALLLKRWVVILLRILVKSKIIQLGNWSIQVYEAVLLPLFCNVTFNSKIPYSKLEEKNAF